MTNKKRGPEPLHRPALPIVSSHDPQPTPVYHKKITMSIPRTDRIRLLKQAFIDRGQVWLTREEAADKLGIPLQSVCSLVLQLKKAGIIFESEKTRDSHCRRPCVVMQICEGPDTDTRPPLS